MKVYQKIAHYLQAIENCKVSGNAEWQERHADNARWHAAMVRATDDVQQCIEDIREARETLQDATAAYERG